MNNRVHFEGNPCKRCQGTVRYKANGNCLACEKARCAARKKPKGPRPENSVQDMQAFTIRVPAKLYLQMHDREQQRSMAAQIHRDLVHFYSSIKD